MTFFKIWLLNCRDRDIKICARISWGMIGIHWNVLFQRDGWTDIAQVAFPREPCHSPLPVWSVCCHRQWICRSVLPVFLSVRFFICPICYLDDQVNFHPPRSTLIFRAVVYQEWAGKIIFAVIPLNTVRIVLYDLNSPLFFLLVIVPRESHTLRPFVIPTAFRVDSSSLCSWTSLSLHFSPCLGYRQAWLSMIEETNDETHRQCGKQSYSKWRSPLFMAMKIVCFRFRASENICFR
jgi:hypothetical protein